MMKNYGFEVSLNGKKLCRAGFDAKHQGLTTILTFARRVLDNGEDFSLYVGGLNSDDNKHYNWVNENLSNNDEIKIKVIDGDFEQGNLEENQISEQEMLKNKIASYHQLKEELKEHLNE